MDISIKNIGKAFNGFVALNDISLDIRSGELIGAARALRVGQDDPCCA
jgi:ABC-type Fe3+/spermidine/putrescine transport system ATPase subunit